MFLYVFYLNVKKLYDYIFYNKNDSSKGFLIFWKNILIYKPYKWIFLVKSDTRRVKTVRIYSYHKLIFNTNLVHKLRFHLYFLIIRFSIKVKSAYRVSK